ncbi:MAG TPA: O-antigen ligase family protein [Stellaceae bacterium]|jgi:O-antigen ligase|nr:O-antigen ligase family protein [Stellaceae bacterium]
MTDATSAGSYDDTDDSGESGESELRRARERYAPGRALFLLLLGFVLLLPLPLGAVARLSWWVIALYVGLLLAAHAASLMRPGAVIGQRVAPNGPWIVPFLLTAAWAALQLSPWTPAAWHNPLWQTAAGLLQTPLAGAISIDPDDTAAAIIRLLAYGGIFWLAMQLCWPRRRAETLFLALSFAAFAYSAYGLIEEFSGAKMVLWFPKSAYFNSVTSTFINRNNYAAYGGLGLICASGMIIKELAMLVSRQPSRRAEFLALLEALAGWRGILLVGWVVSCAALAMSDSRGGVVSTFAGLLALVAAVGVSRTLQRRYVLIIAGSVLAAGIAVSSLNGAQLVERLAETDLSQEGRPLVYALLRHQIAEAPWLGTGYGTFEEAFRPIQSAAIRGRWDRAHDTYLENALELGIPAALLLTLSGAALFIRCLFGLRARHRDAIYPAIGIGASVLLACHSLVDFSLQIPAITATYALIMGAAVIQSWPRRALPAENYRSAATRSNSA